MIFDSQDKTIEVVAEQNRLRMMLQGDVSFSNSHDFYDATCRHVLFEWCDTIKYCKALVCSGQCAINTDLLIENSLQSIQHLEAHEMLLMTDGSRIIRNLPYITTSTLVVNKHKPGILKKLDGEVSLLHIKEAKISNKTHNPIPHASLSFDMITIDGIDDADLIKLHKEFRQYKERFCEGYTHQRLPDEIIQEFIWDKFGIVLNKTTHINIGNFDMKSMDMKFIKYTDGWQYSLHGAEMGNINGIYYQAI